jgi:hypothetical protein
MYSLLPDIAERQQASMLRGPLTADDAFALAIVTKELSLDVAQHARTRLSNLWWLSIDVGYQPI